VTAIVFALALWILVMRHRFGTFVVAFYPPFGKLVPASSTKVKKSPNARQEKTEAEV
jgi:hypothetical protein